ncbi:hypothetical protein GE09DRAFT_500810 [Coniochaeta sp. 2T2.1]|nr:hypothetical protein GE09DRAFT_500810 [Coniochaeta sp. 2T2.1]
MAGDMPPDENVGPTLLAISCILLALIITTTSLRIYTRWSLRTLGWDDYTIAFTAFLAVIRVAIQIMQVRHGNGRHRSYLTQDEYIYNNMLGWYAQILLFASTALLKISIILLILRIIQDSWKLRVFLRAVIVGLVVTNLACIIILLAECDPVDAYWKGGGTCWDTRVRIYSIYLTIAYSILTDLLCSLLPLLIIWNVRMPLRKKLMIWGLMSLGLTATGFGALRASSLGLVTDDLSWTYAIAAIWSNLELFLGINAANLALSLSIWGFIRHGKRPENSQQRSASSKIPRSGHSFGKHTPSLRPDQFDSPTCVVTCRRDRQDSRISEGSDIPLEPGIQKKTEFWLVEDASDNNTSRDNVLQKSEAAQRQDV